MFSETRNQKTDTQHIDQKNKHPEAEKFQLKVSSQKTNIDILLGGDKNPGYLLYIGDDILPNYIDLEMIKNQCMDPYKLTRISIACPYLPCDLRILGF